MRWTEHFFDGGSHLTEEAIALYVDSLKLNRTNQLPKVILEHVADCKECKKEVTELFSVVEDQKYDIAEPHPYFDRTPAGKQSKFSFTYRFAAVLAISAGLGLLFYYLRSVHEEKQAPPIRTGEQAMSREDTAKAPPGDIVKEKETGKDQYAANFTGSPNLEDLVNNEFRSGAIEVLSPSNGAVVRQEILFEWKSDTKAPFFVKVLTNTEELRFTATVSHQRYLFKEKLTPGLYYWKLETKDELLYVGKFLVK